MEHLFLRIFPPVAFSSPAPAAAQPTAPQPPPRAPPPRAALPEPGKASPLLHFAAGWLAATVSAILLSPLEVLKTKQQSSLRPSLGLRADRLLAHIVRTEGVAGLYRGLVPTLLGVGPTRAIFFGGYSFLKQLLDADGSSSAGGGGGSSHGSHLHLFAAAVASMASVTVTSPVWVVKTRLQLQTGAAPLPGPGSCGGGGGPPHYAGVLDAFRKIHAAEGPRAFYRGLSASYLGVLETSLQFVLYDRLKSYVIAERVRALPRSATAGRSEAQLNALVYSDTLSFWVSAATKFVVAVATYPHEVLRTRMREGTLASGSAAAEGGGAHALPRYTSVVQSILLILREEGVKGLYGGMGVHLLRTVPNAAILIYVVERVTGGQV